MHRVLRSLSTLAVAAALVAGSAGAALAHGGNFDRQGRVDPTLPNCVGILNSLHAVDDGGIAHSIDFRFGSHPGFGSPIGSLDQPTTVKEWQAAVRAHCAQES